MAAIAMPILMTKERADDLWKETCFEAFIGIEGDPRYVELNFSPSTRWAAYVFEDTRTGMLPMASVALPRFDMRASNGSLELGVVVDFSSAQDWWKDATWQVGLSAIIETRDRTKSFWALAHGGDEPDFHDRTCFTGILQAATHA